MTALIAFAIKNWKIGAGLVAGFLLASLTLVPIRAHIAYKAGVTVGEANVHAQIASDTLEAEKKRAKSDAILRNLSDHDLCVSGLQRRGLSIEACGDL